MRLLILGNNQLAYRCVRLLREQGEEIVGLVTHPPGRRKYWEELVASSGVDPACVFDGSRLREAETVEAIRSLGADIGLSFLFDYILSAEFIDLFPAGIVNLHPSYLPFNRGQYPNVWSIVEGTPAGVTLHYIDAGIDTGDLIAQTEVRVRPVDTGESLYRRLEEAGFSLFQETWPLIRAGEAPRIVQSSEPGTYHRTRDVERIDAIDLDRLYRAGELIDILRARTFPPYRGAYFHAEGRRIYLRLQLLDEEDLSNERHSHHG